MAWWKQSVVYQIYPRSFYDTNGDGIGDLRGITQKLDYLETLGVNVIWLCPVYQSPNRDGGYDISDYRAISSEFGTIEDWEELVAALHSRGMKLMMDLVVNHTSDEHAWFLESCKSKDNPYRNYYIWRPSKNGLEPSNWGSHFGGSAWKHDPQTDEYYLHLFSEHQPDLNWDNPKLRSEIFSMMRFWLERGVDGFRMDTVNMFSKVSSFPDVKLEQAFPIAQEYFLNGPNLLKYLTEMKTQVLSHYDIMTVGEAPQVTPEQGIAFTHETDGPLNMVFQFEHMQLDSNLSAPMPKWTRVPLNLLELKRITTRWQNTLHNQGWNSLFLSSHDEPRLVSRFGRDGAYRLPSAKMLATFLFTLQGTPYIFQGDEIGMTNVQFKHIEDYRDIDSLNLYNELVGKQGRSPEDVLEMIHLKGRDNARTPMQWDQTPNAGFSTGKPWIGVNPNHTEINVEQALKDQDSIFWYYRDLIHLRREYSVIIHGNYELLLENHPGIFAFQRVWNHQKLLVLLNFAAESSSFEGSDVCLSSQMRLLLGNYPVLTSSTDQIEFQPYEARVYFCENQGGDAMS